MIKTHEFNTEWWGSPVGLITDVSFFALPQQKRNELLAGYSWVEFKHSLSPSLQLPAITQADFSQTDTQIPFRIGLSRMYTTSSLEALDVAFADSKPFAVETKDLSPFRHERFFALPGIDENKINQRYSFWASKLLAQTPELCMQISKGGKTAGWFLSSKSGSKVDLTLAMLHMDSEISGMLLYHKAVVEYARMGFRMGSASFSVTNTPVMNIYASLGARFFEPIGIWLWINPNIMAS